MTTDSGWPPDIVTTTVPAGLLAWARSSPRLRDAWPSCPRADWLLWIAKLSAESDLAHQRCVLAACTVAREMLSSVPPLEWELPERTLAAAEQWARTPDAGDDLTEVLEALRSLDDELDDLRLRILAASAFGALHERLAFHVGSVVGAAAALADQGARGTDGADAVADLFDHLSRVRGLLGDAASEGLTPHALVDSVRDALGSAALFSAPEQRAQLRPA